MEQEEIKRKLKKLKFENDIEILKDMLYTYEKSYHNNPDIVKTISKEIKKIKSEIKTI